MLAVPIIGWVAGFGWEWEERPGEEEQLVDQICNT
jgi:hypothetical protein